MTRPADAPIGVLLAQLGTPDAPTPQAVRPYLREFLSDTRVVDLPPLFWQPILRLIILNTRPKRSAALYQRIWTAEGSPLRIYSEAQAAGVQARLGERFRVRLGMRYGQPRISDAMAAFAQEGIDRILVLPLYPQFSITTTGSIYDAVVESAFGRPGGLRPDRRRVMPALRFAAPYYDDPGYIGALAATLRETLGDTGPNVLLFTFHGVPKRYVDEGDPYRRQCGVTARLLADALGLKPGHWRVSFQSRFGREEWLQPYTDATLARLGAKKLDALLVACPGFTADCLETIDEIGHEGRHTFEEAGGGAFTLAPCLNDQPAWLDALAELARRETLGWSA
jgi:ferrochelatase